MFGLNLLKCENKNYFYYEIAETWSKKRKKIALTNKKVV